jgi:transposase
MQWPEGWKDPGVLDLVKGTPIDYLLVPNGPEFDAVRSHAQQLGIEVGDPGRAPGGIEIVKGSWPGVQWPTNGAGAGPTGVPWVNSNGWLIRLNRALHPEIAQWVDGPPPAKSFIDADSYLIAIADSATHGGRWIVALDEPVAKGIAVREAKSLAVWKRLTATAAFFAVHKTWTDYSPVGVAGIVSDFTGDNEFFSHELLNLMGRAGLHYRILPKDRISATSFESLRAVSYTDATSPSPELRRQILQFVQAGGLLIAAPIWGEVAGSPASSPQPGYKVQAVGKGRVALADDVPTDPYSWAADTAVLVSHRYDLVRFWNSGASRSFYTMSPDRKQAVVHLLFYAERGPDSATVRVAGRYRAVRGSTVDAPKIEDLAIQPQGDGVEVRLPQVSQYVALELDV